jgi:chromosome segregation ATPase
MRTPDAMDISSASSTSYPVTIEQISEHLGFGQPKPLLTIIQEENDQIKSRLATLEAGLIQHAKNMEQRIENMEQRIENMEQRIENMEQRIENMEQRIENMEQRIENIEQTLSQTNELLHKILVKLAIT